MRGNFRMICAVLRLHFFEQREYARNGFANVAMMLLANVLGKLCQGCGAPVRVFRACLLGACTKPRQDLLGGDSGARAPFLEGVIAPATIIDSRLLQNPGGVRAAHGDFL